MKFLIDMPLSPALAVWLTQQGYDAIHALDIGLDRAPDEVILKHAKNEQRVVVTADLDYPRLLALAQAEEPGLILFMGGCFNEQHVVERLARALELVPLEELPHSIVVIEQNRIRRKRLPLAGPD
jgi:predicted nuclease of predicted toxin-antitoxin system